jgi:hypothetical protein
VDICTEEDVCHSVVVDVAVRTEDVVVHHSSHSNVYMRTTVGLHTDNV